MRTVTVFVGALLLAISFTANAGIKDKKAKREAESKITAATDNVKSKCGNGSLAAKVDWSQWEKYDYDKLRKQKHEIIRFSGMLAEGVLEAMAELCKDADYKAEIAGLTTLNFSGKADQSEMYVAFKLNGKAMDIKLNADGVGSWKNADLLKAAWE